MTRPLLTTKLYIPPVRPAAQQVSRPRLIERLNVGLHRKLTLISAPAGFGKTTLLGEWINWSPISNIQSLKVAWVSLDEGDNDPARFLAYLIAALQTIPSLNEAGVGGSVLATLQSPGLGKADRPSAEALLTGLINEIAAVDPDPFVLVLDDYHVIEAQPIHDALTFLLDHLPPQMHLFIATRADPPLPTARLRGRGQLTELRLADLRFNLDEATEFLSQVMGLELAADDVAALASRTEGWIAGLQMAALALRGQWLVDSGQKGPLTTDRFIQSFTGSDRYILDYLVEEVLQRQPESVQTFLLQTAILNRLTGPLCDAVVSEIGDWRLEIGDLTQSPISSLQSQAILEHLESCNLFIVPLDNERRWYRYHRLFADLLRRRLGQTYPGLVPTLHRRASAWCEQNGLAPEAVEHALAAGDFERAAGLMEGSAEAALMRSEIATLLRWVEALPDDVVRARPLLRVYHAGALLLSGHPLDAVQSRLQDVTESDPDGSVAGEVAVFRAMIATFQGDTRRSAELSRRALELLLEESPFLRTIAANNLGITYIMSGDLEAAMRAFEEVARLSQGVGNPLAAVGPLCNLAGLCMTHGQLQKAAAIYRRALELATDKQGRPLPVAGKALMGLGELLREWNDLEAATRYLTEGIEFTRQYLEVGAILGYVSLAYVKQVQGDMEGARDAIQQAEQLAIKFDATEFDDILVAACQARLWVAQGDLKAAMRWVEERGLDRDAGSGVSESKLFHDLRELEYLTLARIYIAQGWTDEALEVLKPLLQAAERRKRMRRLIEILALQALAFQVRGDTEEALVMLKRALSLAEPEGYVRVFIDAGEPMARLLYEAAARGIAPEYAGRLLAVFDVREWGRMSPTPPHAHTQPLIEPLSERELEVLQLIAEGLSNREIAARLVISLSTVKGHTSNIYGKLAVNSRTQAVAKARALGTLPDL